MCQQLFDEEKFLKCLPISIFSIYHVYIYSSSFIGDKYATTPQPR